MKDEKNLSQNKPIQLFYSPREFASVMRISLSSVNRLFNKHREEYPFNRIRKLGRRVLIPFSVIEYLYGEKLPHTEASNE
jgi:hypothetical protein